jgi:hypothetical protein
MSSPKPKLEIGSPWLAPCMYAAIGALLLVIVLSMALSPMFRATRSSLRPNCAMNRDQIASAKQLFATENRLSAGQDATETNLVIYFRDQRFPKCPNGGRYLIKPIGVPPVCSVDGPLPNEELPPLLESAALGATNNSPLTNR